MFYGLFATEIDEEFFKPGKLYVITSQNKTNLFFKINLENIFKCGMNIPAVTPLLYLGIHTDWGCKFHLFLYEDMQVFTIGQQNINPSNFWKEAKKKNV
jgi:hypothetical protein